MKKETLITLFIFILAVAVAVAFGFVYLKKTAQAPSMLADDDSVSASSTIADEKDNNSSGIEGMRTRAELPPFPRDWDKINYGSGAADLPSEAKKRQEGQFEIIVEKINQTPDTVDLWIDLGLIKKIFEDYEGTRDAWEYGNLIRPKNLTSYLNLGDLYWHFLPNFPKSELNYKKALEIAPGTLGIYKDLSDLYRFNYKEKAGLADDILLEGLAQNPENVSILAWLGGYYRDMGDMALAKKYYTEASRLDPNNALIKKELGELGN